MTYYITLLNTNSGNPEGHKAGCADIAKKQAKLGIFADEPWTFDVNTKHEAWVDYNSDFLAEGPEGGTWSIDWKACAKHVPQGKADTYEAHMEADAEVHAEAAPVTTVKRGAKWTYVYVDGTLVAEIRNDQAHLLAAI